MENGTPVNVVSRAKGTKHAHNRRDGKYRFKNGQTGTVTWEATGFWGLFRSDTGTSFTVADEEVTPL